MPIDTEGSDTKTIRLILKLLKKGFPVMVFPEGTRSKTGKFLPAQPGVGYFAYKTLSPVVPVYIKGTNEPMWRHFFRITPLIVEFGDPIYPEEKSKITLDDAQKFSERVMNKIKEMGARYGDKDSG